ncbi:TPA: hypothetical protein ACGF30_000078 [Vibrio cholerae]|nr:hypothetical protein [Vibrio cholerae]
MANNLFISYDLNSPGQDYSKVIEEIQSLGGWAKVHKSFWYVNSDFTAEQAAKRIWSKMDSNDSLIVIDSTGNHAYWYNLNPEVSKYLQDYWYK